MTLQRGYEHPTGRHVIASAALLVMVVLTSCANRDASSTALQPAAARDTLTSANWSVKDAPGMKPIAGGSEIAYFETTSPDGVAVTLQLLDSTSSAQRELEAASQQIPGFQAFALRNALVFTTPDGKGSVPERTRTQLRELLGA